MPREISRVMDCVGCDKCKLWGKIQTTGLATALKILFTDDQVSLNFRRGEIVSLINAVGRLSHSIHFVENFHQMHKKQLA